MKWISGKTSPTIYVASGKKKRQISRPGRSSHLHMPTPIYALILAGGSGERFWPLSRRTRPKQLLRLVSDKVLLEETLARLEGLVPHERILILTNTEQENAVRKLLTGFPKRTSSLNPLNATPLLRSHSALAGL